MHNRSGRAGIPYSPDSAEWLIDDEAAVSRNDVLYTTPSPDPWEAMPVGGGDLSAMARWDGSLRLHLTKSDCWGYSEPADAPLVRQPRGSLPHQHHFVGLNVSA